MLQWHASTCGSSVFLASMNPPASPSRQVDRGRDPCVHDVLLGIRHPVTGTHGIGEAPTLADFTEEPGGHSCPQHIVEHPQRKSFRVFPAEDGRAQVKAALI